MDESRPERYLRHQQIEGFAQGRVAAMRVVVVGAGAVGNEVVKNLALLGVGHIAVHDFDRVEIHNLTRSIFLRESDVGAPKAEALVRRAAEVDPNVSLRAIPGNFWDTLSLGRLQRSDCAVAAVDNYEARVRLNKLCLIAGVDLVNVAVDSRWVAVEAFHFGASRDRACYECHLPDSAYARMAERYSCGGLRRRGLSGRPLPTTAITASMAGALAASRVLHMGGTAAHRVLLDTQTGTGARVELGRRADCPGCGSLSIAPRIVRTRNRWRASVAGIPDEHPNTDQLIELSDALITDYSCTACGALETAAQYLNRRAADFDDTIATGPRCAAPSVRIEIRDTFLLGELMQRFGGSPVPARYALTEIHGRPVCFDLEEDIP